MTLKKRDDAHQAAVTAEHDEVSAARVRDANREAAQRCLR
jgi:hypothetical protein